MIRITRIIEVNSDGDIKHSEAVDIVISDADFQARREEERRRRGCAKVLFVYEEAYE